MSSTDRLIERRSRAASSVVVAVVAIVAAAAAHGLAGGGVASLPALVSALIIGVPLGMLVVGRRITAARAVAGVAIDQALFHALFAFFGPEGRGADAAAPAHHLTHGSHLEATATITSLGVIPMVVSHAAAAVVALAVLLHGRDAIARGLASLARTIVRALDPAPRIPHIDRAPAAYAEPAVAPIPATRALLTHPHRGPPTHLVTSADAR